MISPESVRQLAQRESQPGSMLLSVYLDVDQSRAANLNRGFETALRNMIRSVEQQIDDRTQRDKLARDAARVERFVASYTPRARTLCLFCDDAADFLWTAELAVSLPGVAHWSPAPHVQPLLETLDEFERYGVVVVERARARLFTVHMEAIEEHPSVTTSAGVSRTASPGRQAVRSQMNFQRKADEHVSSFLKSVVEALVRLSSQRGYDHLVLCGTSETAGALGQALPKRLRERVAAMVPMQIESDPREVLAAVVRIEQEAERRREAQLVEELITAAAKQDRAALGLDPTLASLNEGRVWRLVYAEGFKPRGWRCGACGALYSERVDPCALCHGATSETADLMDLIAHRTLETGGKVELLRGDPAARLASRGSIGAILRF